MSPLRIALVITELDVGGAEQSLMRLATGLDPNRFQPVVYSLAPLPPAGKDQLVAILRDARIPVHALGIRGWRQAPLAAGRLAGLLRQQRPQIVQTFLFHANVAGWWAARRAKAPQVLLGVRVADGAWWRGKLECYAARRAGGVVCVSQAVADFCRERHRFPADKLIVIPNGVDVDRLAQTAAVDVAALGIPPGRKLLAFIGRLEPQKDPRWLLEIANLALPQLPEHELVIVGDGSLRSELQRAAGRSPQTGRIHFALWRKDATAILAASQMLLLTSQHEGMPNVVLEAMALARPVMATRAEGVGELLGPAADEQTAAWRDTSEFVRSLVRLARDQHRCEQLGTINQQRAREQFSMQRMVAAYARLYEQRAGS